MVLSDWPPTDISGSVSRQSRKLPAINEVEGLSPKIKQILQVFKQKLETLYDERLASLVLYGSFARHEDTEGSDVDVLVVLKGAISQAEEILRMGQIKTDLLLTYGELISVVPASQHDFLHRDSPLLQNIRCEGILV